MVQRTILFQFSFCLLLPSLSQRVFSQQPIGQWRDHLPYHQSTHVIATANKLWSATPYSLFSVDVNDNTIERWSKINGLNETGISTIGVDGSGKIVIAYNNSNVDVLYNDEVHNINTIKNTAVSGDKNIYHIFIHNNNAYLSTGMGIIVIDLNKYEVKETYVIGTGGNKIKINAVATDANFFYAATEEGLKKLVSNATNPADFRNWQLISGTNGLPLGAVQQIEIFQNRFIVQKNDSLFISNANNWNFFYSDGWVINGLDVSDGKILLNERLNNQGRIVVLTASGSVDRIIQDTKFTIHPRQSIFFQNHYWIADSIAGVSEFSGSSFESYIPNSPYSISTGEMKVFKSVLWAASGSVTRTWEPTGNKNGLYKFFDNSWTNYNSSVIRALDSFPDIITITIDPRDESIWAGSFGGGLINIKSNNAVNVYKQNSSVQPVVTDPTSYRVSGLAFDEENDLWIANYGAAKNIVVYKSNNTWQQFIIPFPIADNAVSQIVIDDFNQKWIVVPKGGGLICFNHGNSIENTGDDRWKWFRFGKGDGNLPDNDVLSIAKDKNGFIWVGTKRGVGIIQCPQDIFIAQGCEAILPVVQQDNFAGYLFRDEEVQAIAVDGADRKWIGTLNGVWLISADAEKTIYRFTEENSPLPNDDVKQIAIDGKTGEIFFATAKGIFSYRGTATEGTTSNTDVLVFPNPVPPGYNGSIAIRGVANNAILKITELDGRLVFQTRALGGQAIWNGNDYRGRKISTGVYLVLISDETGKEKMVTKIVFIK